MKPHDDPEPVIVDAYRTLDLAALLAAPPEEPEWDWRGFYARGDVVLEAGDPGVGKSMNAQARAVLSTTGGGEHLGEAVTARRCLYVDLESPDDVVYQRLYGFGLRGPVEGFSYVHRPLGFNLLDDKSAERLWETVGEHDAEVVVIDSLRRAAPGLDENDSRDVSSVFNVLRELAARDPLVTVIVVHHPRKPVGDSKVEALYAARGSGDLIGSVDSYLFYRRLSGGLVRIEHAKARRGREHDAVHYRIVADEDGFPRVEHVELQHGLDDEALAALVDQVVAFATDRPGASQKDVRDGVTGTGTAIDRALTYATTTGLLVLGPGRATNGKYFYPADHALFSSSDDQRRPATTSVPSSPSGGVVVGSSSPVGGDDHPDELDPEPLLDDFAGNGRAAIEPDEIERLASIAAEALT